MSTGSSKPSRKLVGLVELVELFGGWWGDAVVCQDGVKNGSETDVDCGGSCEAKCFDGHGCSAPGDCVSHACAGNVCVSCGDGVKNGDETDVDCGDSCAARCLDGASCVKDADCASGRCGSDNLCSSCNDHLKNGMESGIDCGGPCMTSCPYGEGCSADGDCASSHCDTISHLCWGCDDHKQNGNETDVDCGGSCLTKCSDGAKCKLGTDCTSAHCDAALHVCRSCGDHESERERDRRRLRRLLHHEVRSTARSAEPWATARERVHCGDLRAVPACNDTVANGTESDVDCGGSCAPATKCADTKKCKSPDDCASGVCTAGACVAPACNDSVANGTETDVDCGGSCSTECPGAKCKLRNQELCRRSVQRRSYLLQLHQHGERRGRIRRRLRRVVPDECANGKACALGRGV